VELDHVLIAVADLAEAGAALESRHGLTAIEGGRHDAWGTANRIVPLGGAYLELIAVVDEDQARPTDFGRWVLGHGTRFGRPLGWAVRTDDIDAVAGRLGLVIGSGSRPDREGRPVRWRSAGLERAVAEPSHPFFIEWDPETVHPGRAAVTHPAGSVRVAGLELSGDEDGLRGWLGGPAPIPVTVGSGPPGVERVLLEGDHGGFALHGGAAG